MRIKCIHGMLNNIPGSWIVHDNLEVLVISLVKMW